MRVNILVLVSGLTCGIADLFRAGQGRAIAISRGHVLTPHLVFPDSVLPGPAHPGRASELEEVEGVSVVAWGILESGRGCVDSWALSRREQEEGPCSQEPLRPAEAWVHMSVLTGVPQGGKALA